MAFTAVHEQVERQNDQTGSSGRAAASGTAVKDDGSSLEEVEMTVPRVSFLRCCSWPLFCHRHLMWLLLGRDGR